MFPIPDEASNDVILLDAVGGHGMSQPSWLSGDVEMAAI
jgi:hypothetical protein